MTRARPRLCIVTPVHWKAFMGGSQYQIKCLLDYMRSLDRFEIHYVARRVPDDRMLDGYEIHRIGGGGSMPRLGYGVDAWSIFRILDAIRPDVIYQRIGCAYTGIAAFYARRRDSKLVWHAASDADLDRKLRVAERNVLRTAAESAWLGYGIRHANRIVVQTDFQASLLERNHRRTAHAVIPNFHPEPFEIGPPDRPFRIVWIANFKQVKQPEVFIRLAEALQDLKGVQFVMIGAKATGRDAARWNQAMASRIAALPSVKYLGPLSQDEVNAQLNGAYALVNTSLYEGFPNTFIQAWLRAVPVVSLAVDPDGVLGGKAVGIAANSEANLSAAIRHLLENREFHDLLARNAVAHARAMHSMKNAARLTEVIESAIHRP